MRVSVVLFLTILPVQIAHQDPAVAMARAKTAVDTMMTLYDGSTGRWHPESLPWWQSGNAMQALLDYMVQTQNLTYLPEVINTIQLQRAPLSWWPRGQGEFRADSTDVTGWWALALVRVYDLTQNTTYLDIAELDMIYMHDYWDDVCGGGIYWDIEHLFYKNAISIELYIKLAASLHNRIPNDKLYLQYALEALEWFNASGMVNQDNLVNDGLNVSCFNNGGTTWTYNQGVILGGLAELYLATGDDNLLDFGRLIANAVVSSPLLSPNGTLTEPCEAWRACNPNQMSFKGIFVRNLAQLDNLLEDRPYRNYLLKQADSAYEYGRNGTDHYSLSWSGPFDSSTFSIGTQSAAVSLLTAVLVDHGKNSSLQTVSPSDSSPEPTVTPTHTDLSIPTPSLSPLSLDPSDDSPTLNPLKSNSPTALSNDLSEPSTTPSPTSTPSEPSLDPLSMATNSSRRAVFRWTTFVLALGITAVLLFFLCLRVRTMIESIRRHVNYDRVSS